MEVKWGEEDQGLNFRSSLGYSPLYSSRFTVLKWVMVPIGDLADVALAIEDTDEDEEEEEDEGCANFQPLLEEGKRNGARRISGWILGAFYF